MYKIIIICCLIAIVTAQSNKKQCEISQDIADYNSIKMLFYGDRNASFPRDEKAVNDYCRMIQSTINTQLRYARCLKPFPKTVLGLAIRGYKKVTKNRCLNKEWRKAFVKFGKCVLQQKIQENLHICMDNCIDAFDYILNNVPVKDQILLACCVYAGVMSTCMEKNGAKCGKVNTDFAHDMFEKPTADAFDLVCSSVNTRQKCEAKYPKYLKDIFNHLKIHRKPTKPLMVAAIQVMLGEDDGFFDL